MRQRLLLTALAALAMAAVAAVAAPVSDARPRAAKKVRLGAFSSCAQLVRYGRAHARLGTGGLPTPGVSTPEPLSGPLPPAVPGDQVFRALPGAAAPESGSSGTNVQEAGVDEPDLVKAARGRIFAVAGNRLNAIDVGGTPRLLGSLELNGSGHQLLLSGDRLLVIAGDVPVGAPEPRGNRSLPIRGGLEVTELTEVDVSDPSAMRVVRTERIRGSHVSSRLTGRTARVVVWTRPRAVAEPALRAQLKGWLPRRVARRPAGGPPRYRPAARCRRVLRPAAYSGTDLLTVLTIDLSKGLPAVDSDAIMGGGQVVYASPRNLFVATPRWIAAPGEARELPPERTTTIHRFSASDPGRTAYTASGAVPGYLLNQFAVSEDRGILRVASTDEPEWWNGSRDGESQSFVTTLEERGGRLVRLGQVGGLGRGERVFAVRFIGDAGYVVTFRQVDPLYVVDLSKPSHPRVAGELKVLGYSAYLHPIGRNLLLGIGQDATESGTQTGGQLSLFDVSEPSRPRRLHRHRLGGGSWSEAEQDHHAFLWWAPRRLAVMPVQNYPPNPFFGAVGFRVARSSGITEVGRASHAPRDYSAAIRRSLVVDGKLITVSDFGIAANSMDTLAEQAWLAFPLMDEHPGPAPRSRLVAGALLALVLAGLLVVALASSGGGDSPGGLRLEISSPQPDGSTPLLVYLEDEADNVPATANGRSSVRVRCVDQAGETVIDVAQAWPFTDTDSGTLAPHAHVTLPPVGQVARCLLDGTEGPLEGDLDVRG